MPTIDKALGLLDHFSNNAPEIGLAKFCTLSGFDKGTVHRYLSTLRDCGYVEQNPVNKAYRLGPALIRLAVVREQTVPLEKVVAPLLDALAEQTNELVHAALASRTGMSALYVKDGGQGGTRVGFDEAEILPFHATSSGIAFLAYGPGEYLHSISNSTLPSFTDLTADTTEKVHSLAGKTRKAGYAYSDQSYEAEVCSVAMPFFDNTSVAIGTVAIATPRSRMKRKALVKPLAQTSLQLTQNLGGTVPGDLSSKWNSL